MKVLSGSSTTKIAPKAIAMTAGSTRSNLSVAFRQRSSGNPLPPSVDGCGVVSGVDHLTEETTMAKFEHYDQGTPSWVELVTPDQGAAREFYRGMFGWDYNDSDMGDMGHYYVATIEGDE